MSWFRKKTPEPAADEFHGIMVTLLVGANQASYYEQQAAAHVNLPIASSVNVGQAYELEVAINAPLSPARVGEAVRGFHQAHERVYGYSRTEQPVELVNFAAVHRYPLPRPVLSPPAPAASMVRMSQRDGNGENLRHEY